MALAFLDCVLDTSCFELTRKGRLVKVEPKVFDVLVFLIEHRDRVVPKHELLDALWPGEAVSDSVLPRCIAAARRATGDARNKQKVIQTVHGRGYRFVAPLEEEGAGGAAAGVASRAGPPEASTGVEEAAPDGPSFVGRADALERFDRVLGSTAEPRTGVVLLVGEPGIGKTRTAEVFAECARSAGFEVLGGRCFEGEGAPPYWPWVQILRDAARETDDSSLREQLGPSGADLLPLAPELQERFPDWAPAAGEGEQARFRLYDAAARFFAARSASRPLLLLLDDLHWADASSLGLLRFVVDHCGRSELAVVATYRDVDVRRGHPLTDLLGSLARGARCERIALGGLSAAEIAALVKPELASDGTEIARATRAEAAAERLHAMTEGNPFFVHELVRWLVDRGELEAAARGELEQLALPQGVRDALGRRLDLLSSECNRMLRLAAVVGREFQASLLFAALDGELGPSEDVLELLGEALDLAIVVDRGAGRYAFAHALTRQTLYEELRAPQRIALHRRVGLAIEAAAGPTQDDRSVELAHHFFEAAAGGEAERALRYCNAAARRAFEQHAYHEAVEQRRRALEAGEADPALGRERGAELLLALGEDLFTAGERDRARETLFRAGTEAAELGRSDLLARAAIAIRGYGETGMPPSERDRRFLEEALERLPEDEVVLRARLIARLSGAVSDTMAERRQLAERAMSLARECGDPLALREALASRWWATLGPDSIEERKAIGRELRELARHVEDERVSLLALECEVGAALVEGDRATIEASIEEYDSLAGAIRQPIFQFIALQMRAAWMLSSGAFDRVEEILEEIAGYDSTQVAFSQVTLAGLRYSLARTRGEEVPLDTGWGHALGSGLRGFFRDSPLRRVLLATIRQDGKGPDELRAQIEEIQFDGLERDEHWLIAMGVLSDLAFDAGDVALMERLYPELLPYGHLMAVHDLLRLVSGSVWAILGELAHGCGRFDRAVEHYQQAIQSETQAGLQPAVVTSGLGLARALRARGGPGDPEAAAEAHRRAAELESTIGSGYLAAGAGRALGAD